MVGHVDRGFLSAGGIELALETPLDINEQAAGPLRGANKFVPNEEVDEINANLENQW